VQSGPPLGSGSPFAPGAQTQVPEAGSPFSPGTQNQAWNWPNQNQWNQNQWDDGWYDEDGYYNPGFNPYWQQQQQWQQRPPVAWSNEPITIGMPEGEPGICAYSLTSGFGGWNYTITPGKSQTFQEDRPWSITFDRGDNRGTQTYRLKPGQYRFRHGENGWELFRSEFVSGAVAGPAVGGDANVISPNPTE
jgi:hypothetical protein